jgi:hypothetical protein
MVYWNCDMVSCLCLTMDVTCTLLAPHLAPGVRLVPSYMLHSLLSGGDLAERRWSPLLSARTILIQVVREGHLYLLLCLLGLWE